MGSFAFWSPVLRAWFSAMPYFIVGFGGLILQLERMRKSANKTIETQTAALRDHLDSRLDGLKATLTRKQDS